jgi:hypothetical protein
VFGAAAVLTWNLPHVTTAEPVYAALFICFGIPGVAMLSGLISSLQQATADGERGRIFAAFGAASAFGHAVGMVAAGILGDRFGAVPLLNVPVRQPMAPDPDFSPMMPAEGLTARLLAFTVK